ncbi:ferrochelatase [Pantoea sp. Nvir]|uniref:ferrochelatase n=1 Tax=Pantoea sp. Nvir TaxID=2576760 RepID=UPI00135C1338|nr:ferrochelatase [Pantoea sp. Nvir]MXP66361.1 ferrochelatase [Pantoea sp. Nvir]
MRENKPGVLLTNLGTPDAPNTAAVKRYLKQFLSDPRVVDTPRWLWWLILNGIVLPFRAPRVSKSYTSVWMDGGSPLMVYSKQQLEALTARVDMPVELGMSYGNPCLQSAVTRLMIQGVTRMIVLPLYPQFSCSTVAAVWDGLYRAFKMTRTLPDIEFIRDYAEHPAYIAALKASVERFFVVHGKPDLLVFSYHGIPQRFANEGDDYPQRCSDTTILLQKALGLRDDQIIMTFQSRFGCEPWLQPYTDKTIQTLVKNGIKHVQVIAPGFAADCLETLEEISVQNREFFLRSGGEKFEYIPALNANTEHIDMMVQLVNGRS